MSEEPMEFPAGCSHDRTFEQRCVECEIVLAKEGLASAKNSVERYSALLSKLEAERAHQQPTQSETK